MRLAEVVGTWDVDSMLDTMPPEVFELWLAKDSIEPIGNAGVTALLATIGGLLVTMLGKDNLTTAEQIKSASSACGRDWRPIMPQEERATAAQVGAMLRAAGGNIG